MSTTDQSLDEVQDELAPVVATGRRWVSQAQAAAICQVDHFRNSGYRKLDLNQLIDSYVHEFVEPLLRLQERPSRVADVGAGYGWLAFAFALRTDARLMVVEADAARLPAAQQIAAILGVADRMEWITAAIAGIPLADQSVDAAYCVEVIEHTGVEPAFVGELARITRDVLVITTPNKLFPVIGHDTKLPFCHWLPLPARDVYARLFRRTRRQHNNLFWTPQRLFGALPAFQRTSTFLQFESYGYYRQARARRAGRVSLLGRCKAAYFMLAAVLGRHAVYAMPNLATTLPPGQLGQRITALDW